MSVYQRYRRAAPSVQAGSLIATPEANTRVIRLPRGGVVWSRPHGVRVVRHDTTQYIRIDDPTRRLQWLCWSLALLCLIIGLSYAPGEA